MAWYALCLWFRQFRKSMYPFNANSYYRKYLYDEWYNNLTDEQRARVDQRNEELRKKEELEHQQRMLILNHMLSMARDWDRKLNW